MLPPLLAPAMVAVLLTASGSLPPALVPAPPPSWRAPLAGPVVVLAGFDAPDPDWLPGHRGVDLMAFPGEPVMAAGEGTVTYAARVVDRGVLVVGHPDGRTTTYEPVEAEVRAGDEVAVGDRLGVLGRGGHCNGVCLHWGLVAADGVTYQDPLALLRPPHAVLLPLDRGAPGPSPT